MKENKIKKANTSPEGQAGSENMSTADVDAVMKKYDRESNIRVWTGKYKLAVRGLLVAFSLWCIYVTLFATFLEEIRLTSFLGLIILIGFLTYPAKKGDIRENYMPIGDIIFMIAGAGAFLYFTFSANQIINQGTRFAPYQIVIGIIGIAALIELTRRCVGLPILFVAGFFLIYALAVGLTNPAFFGRVKFLVRNLFYTKEGIFSTPVNVCSKYIVVFIIFGAFLERTGISNFFIQLANCIAGKYAGGPAKVVQDLIDAVSLAVVIIVCAVPEGLPLMISLVLMQNTSKMLDHNVLVRKAEGIETAGSLNILFSDKTGTITKGELEVVDFFTADGTSISANELRHHGKVKGLLDLAIGKNTQAMFDVYHKVIGGNATDQALLKFIGEETFCMLDGNDGCKVSAHQGFNSSNKFSQARIESIGKTFYKGAPERLLAKATKYLDGDGQIKEIDQKALNQKIDSLAAKAMRVLAFGYSEKELVKNQINDDLVIIGLVAIRDDVRPSAKDAIRQVQEAGIQVVMITGDRLETAVAIAKDAGLLKNESDRALSSAQLNQMSDEEVKAILPQIRVIARALPTDKSRMVRLCQEMNLVVGMTGDGVNDSPALKRADVGFAMGSGTEAAKEAGKIVILDDNFSSIKDAIWYGRTIYHNILKFCKFQLVINVTAVVVSAVAPFLGIEEPLKVTHLLFVNLVMDGLGAMMLGNEPALSKYMKEAPRRRDEGIISKDMMTQIGFMGIWLVILSFLFLKLPVLTNLFDNKAQHLTAYFVLFIFSALFNGFNVRDERFGIFKRLNENPDFLKVFFIIMLVQIMIVNAAAIPFQVFIWIGKMFSCIPFGAKGWIVTVLLSMTMIPVDCLRKFLFGCRK